MSNLFKRTHLCGVLNINDVDKEVVLNGWVAKRRNLGGLIFVDLRDKTGITQITFDDNIPAEVFVSSLCLFPLSASETYSFVFSRYSDR